LIENMSGFVCPHCHKETDIFTKGGGEKEAEKWKIPYLGAVPLDPDMVRAGDSGVPIVVGKPASPQTKALRWAAQVVAGQISIANMEGEAALPAVK
jgi:ATP-binding protein involved in chromosome partitioning